MRSIRLFTITVAVGLTAALSPAAVGVAHAAASRPAASPEVSMWSRPWYKRITAACPSAADLRTPGAMYQVADAGIHIRVSPDGTAISAISKGTQFASDWTVGNVSGYQCVVTTGGKTWVLGVSESGATGWVRLDYLGYARPFPVH